LNMPYRYESRTLTRLGVRSWINASNWSTTLGGTWLSQEVNDAMEEVSKTFVRMNELIDKTGERIAELCKVDAAFVSTGAAGGIELSVAASMTGKDTAKIRRLPDTTGMKNEVVMHKGHSTFYDPQWTAPGAKLIYYGTAGYLRFSQQELEDAITEQTCCLGYVNSYHTTPRGFIPIEDVVRVARKHELPVIVDTASILPPVANLHRFADAGADISIFSGGKGIRGPNDTGLILAKGKRGVELIEALKLFASPNGGWGRGLKVSKEQIVGLLVALEIFVREGDTWYEKQMQKAKYIAEQLKNIGGFEVDIIPNDEALHEHPVSPHVPRVRVQWNPVERKLTSEQVDAAMAEEEPPVVLRTGIYFDPLTNKASRLIDTYYLRDGEEEIVAGRLRRILLAHRSQP